MPGIWMSRNRMSGECCVERVQRLDAVLGFGADDELGPERGASP